jgi:hypothetical protein
MMANSIENPLSELAPGLTGLSEIAMQSGVVFTSGYKSDILPAYHRQK